MRHGSLFSGIGGFDLASEWMGWENVFHCEWNEFGQKVLNYYWPKAISYHDITKTDFSIHRGQIDILTGGFPCQPYSTAGKRKGKEDERHLWPEMLRAIREIQPTWVVGENVLGLVNWDGGLVFHEVQAELEAQGYEVQPYVFPAASVNAPHKRDRVWFVAYSYGSSKRTSGESGGIKENWSKNNLQSEQWRNEAEFNNGLYEFQRFTSNSNHKRRDSGFGQVQGENGEVSEWDNDAKPSDSSFQPNATNTSSFGLCKHGEGQRLLFETLGASVRMGKENATDSELKGLQGQHREWQGCSEHRSDQRILIRSENQFISTDSDGIGLRRQSNGIGESRFFDKEGKIGNWDNFPTVSPICSRNDGISERLDSITFSKWRNESIKAGGNAIVPQVVHQIFKAIEQYETTR